MPPRKGIRIEFVEGSRTWLLRIVDANKAYAFRVTITGPRDAGLGTAKVRAGGVFPFAEFRVTGLAGTGSASAPLAAVATFLVAAGIALRQDWNGQLSSSRPRSN